MKTRRNPKTWLLMSVFLLVLAVPTLAAGAVFIVNSVLDKVDLTPGNGVVDTDTPGEITLRAAIMEGNALAGDDTISVPVGTYTLSIAGTGEDAAATGDLDITDTTGSLTITGASADTTIIDAARLDRVFHVFVDVTMDISDVTIRNGLPPNNESGGGIFNSGTLTVANSTISGNGGAPGVSTQFGGGIFNTRSGTLDIKNSTLSRNVANSGGGGVWSNGSMTVTNSTMLENRAGRGGAIDNSGANWGGTLTVTNSIFSENTASSTGGGLNNTGRAQITNSTFSDNSAGAGGALSNALGTLEMSNTIVSRNFASFGGYGGGGIFNYSGGVTITSSSFSDNSANRNGGGISNFYGGVTIRDSNISGNSATGDGGGIFITAGWITITNSTLSANSAEKGGGGIHSGPHPYNTIHEGELTITSSTVSANVAVGAGGGGISRENGSVIAKNTIIASNTATTSDPDLQGLFTSQGHNLIGVVGSATGFTDGVNGDQVGSSGSPIDPLLGPLQDNGGPTFTHALLVGSPAIDAGNNTGAPPTDQRGEPRPIDGDGDGIATVDIGAFEAPPSCTPVSLDSLSADPLVVPLGNAVNFEATIADGCGEIDALWDFDDGTIDSQTNVTSPVTTTKTYASAGVYTVVLTVSDDRVDVGDIIIVVVYDPTGGFVTGGGWIDSPAGAYTPDTSLTGKANFGFVSKYKKGASAPTGNTEFVFKAGDLNFHSSSYDWLVVTGSDYAKFKGTGTKNGYGEYRFMVWAGDGPDTFRIKIWTEDDVGNETVEYDNDFDQDIMGGNIVIHAGK